MLGYTSWYQLFVYNCKSCLLSTHMLFSVILQFSCLSCCLVILWLQFILLLFCAHCLYARAFPFTHTHSSGHFLTTLDLYFQILDALFLLFRCSMRLYASQRAGASPYSIPVFLSFLPSYYFLILVISDLVVIPVFIHMISCMDAYVILQ